MYILYRIKELFFKMFGAMHFIYYINRSITTKVDSTYWAIDQQHMERICLVASGGRELVTFRSLSPTLSHYTTHCRRKIQLYILVGH